MMDMEGSIYVFKDQVFEINIHIVSSGPYDSEMHHLRIYVCYYILAVYFYNSRYRCVNGLKLGKSSLFK